MTTRGYQLDSATRRRLERSLGADLSAVRVHVDPVADRLAHVLGADAFAFGDDLFFREDRFDPHSTAGLHLLAHEAAHTLDADELTAELAAHAVVTGARCALPTATAAPRGRRVIRRHASWEHRLLGDVPQADMVSVALKAANRTEILQRERQLMWLWHQGGAGVDEKTITDLCPWIRTLRLPNNVLMTYGELNSLPDYLATPTAIDTLPQTIVEPLLQQVRQESYNRINALLGTTDLAQFSGVVEADWGPGLFNTLLETTKLDTFTWDLGINHSDHYKGLLARNACHFAPFAWWRYFNFTLIARDLALKAYQTSDSGVKDQLTRQAWINAGYAEHFLQDSFAAGHLINKTLIMQWFVEWASQKWYVPVSNWGSVSKMTTQAQPQLAGLQRYVTNTGSTDPQTAEEQPTLEQRISSTGVTAPTSPLLNDAYQNYLTFLDNAVVQSASAGLHDYYNAKSLWVTSPARGQAYQLWGDDTLLNGGDGVGIASESTHLSQQAISEILVGGTTSITPQSVMETFPTQVRDRRGTMLPLQQWHTDDVRALCCESVFPELHYYLLRPAPLAHMQYVSQDQGVPSPVGPQGDPAPMLTLETMGWDVAYVTTFAQIAAGLRAAGAFPSTFNGSDASANATATGNWDDWAFASGSPSNFIWLQAKLKQGTLTTPNGTIDISGSSWTVQFGLTLGPGVAVEGKQGIQWTLNPTASGKLAPIIVDHNAPMVGGTDAYALMAIMQSALPPQVLAMGSTFGSIVLGGAASTPDQQWLMPTGAAFACEAYPADDARGGVCALLGMTEGRSMDGLQPVIDRRAFEGAPDGTNSAMIVGPNLVVRQLLQPALQSMIQGSTADNFSTDQTGTVVFNNAAMTWGSFDYVMSDGSTATVTPRVPQGNVELALNGQAIHLTMSDINFPYPGWSGPGEITVAFDVQQFIALIFAIRDDGKLVIVPDVGTFNTPFNVTIIPSHEMRVFQIALDAAIQVLMCVLGGLLEGWGEAAEGALTAEGEAGGYAAKFTETELTTFVSEAESQNLALVEEEGATLAGSALEHAGEAGYLQQFKSAVISNKWKIYSTLMDKMVTIPVGQISNIALWAAKSEFDKLPAMDMFAMGGMQPVTWGSGSEVTLTGGALMGAMVVWGSLSAPGSDATQESAQTQEPALSAGGGVAAS